MDGLLGKKIGMTQIFAESGEVVPITVLEVGPCYVIQVKTEENDGYTAVQLGFDDKKPKHTSQPLQGHFKKGDVKPKRILREFHIEDTATYKPGQVFGADVFGVGDVVDVTGLSKGRGFQGVVKRHNFRGGPKTHGQSDRLRAPGSIGASSSPSRVFKGTRMAGRMGNRRVTVKGISVVGVDIERNLLLIKGAVPGHNNSYVMIRRA